MINNNKILTVSYGTFSCTLEGFDDSFGTMKAIAEYFRDLAADDRYFGAEPAQPDAQMLARIAQREISRHVDARNDDGRIVLSARSTPLDAALVATDVVEDVATAVADATTTKAVLAPQDIEASAPEEKPEQAAVQKTSVAIPAPRVRITTAAPVAAHDQERDIVPSLPDAEVEAFFAERPADRTASEARTPTAAVSARTADGVKADSIADKLKRIRAVVSQQAEDAAAPDYSEDQHADATAGKAAAAAMAAIETSGTPDDTDDTDDTDEIPNNVLAATLRDLEDALDADDALEPDDAAYDDDEALDNDDDDITAILNRLEAEAAEPAVSDEDEYETETDDDTGSNILAAMDDTDALIDADDENLFDGEETSAEAAPVTVASAPTPTLAPTPVTAPATTPPPAPRTRVLKVKRATLEAAIQSGKLEEYEDEDEEDIQPEALPLRKAPLSDRSTLSDAAEDELARELAELEADMKAADEADELEENAYTEEAYDEDEEEEAQKAETPKPGIRGSTDAHFSRLMEETDHQMEEPESTTRRDAFAHLRAAVAAKKADEAVGGDAAEKDTGEAYRDDLANVVRPRRPVSGERTRTERPAEQRPAPLKLVAEQRIDVNAARTAVPVRPRRVAAVAAAPAPTQAPVGAASFADFAREMGAEKLPDLLEAAAAYLSFVEGHEQFSRPQLMGKVRQVEQENFTREDSLRSFGKLLREGKIEKLKGGRFQASDQIGFKPDARAVG